MTARVARWLRCPRKDCCSFSFICVTGDDVARVARRLSLEPWHFTVLIRAPSDCDDGFVLDHSTDRFRLALKRTDLTSATESGSCAFLARLADGAARCGLGPLRPAACRVFPAHDDPEGALIDPVGCTCDWSGVEIDDATRTELAAMVEARTRYVTTVARWNAFVREQPASTSFEARDFERFLLDEYRDE